MVGSAAIKQDRSANRKHTYFIFLAIVLAQPRKAHPYITERLLMGRKESNKQTPGQPDELSVMTVHVY